MTPRESPSSIAAVGPDSAPAGMRPAPSSAPAVPSERPRHRPRILQVWRTEGVRAFALKVLHELGIFRYCEIQVYNRSAFAHVPDAPAGVRCARLERDQVDRYIEFRPDQEREDVLRRLDMGHVCYVAWAEERIVATGWSARGRVHHPFLGCDFEIADDAFYGHDAFVLPAYRGSNVIHAIGKLAHVELGPQYPRSFAVSWPLNHAARRRQEKGKDAIAGIVGFIGLGPWRRYFVRLNAGAGASGQPLLRLVSDSGMP